jgi:amino acid transporter
LLGQWASTAISGNDILSSCLYVCGLTASVAGIMAPLVLLLVALVLSFYKRIYAEVVTALPKNGGVFNALIHTTSKGNAALASCLSILSYVATGVVSGLSAVQYLIYLVNNCGATITFNLADYTVPLTIGLLFIFAMLCFMGLKESSLVATCNEKQLHCESPPPLYRRTDESPLYPYTYILAHCHYNTCEFIV